jgi:glycosyltransferase involved in cell wall biosynthesis
MSAGKPVIGVSEGGLLETVVHTKTGWLTSPDPSSEELIRAIKEMTPGHALSMRDTCEKRADIFCTNNFRKNMREIIS